MESKTSSILILGGGTFGLSTAYHLARVGYQNVTVLERSPVVPPEQSAGNDLNKIIRAEYEDPFYTNLALEAIEAWRTPLFSPYYHQVGYLLANSPAAPQKAKDTLQRSLKSISNHPVWAGNILPINKRSDITSVAPVFTGPMNWTGYFNKIAGYAHSADALCALYSACCALGVTMHLDTPVSSLNYSGKRCTGATTASGQTYSASTTIVALGAAVASIIPSIAPQIGAIGFPVAHIQLSPSEAAPLRGMPVTYARDLGFFFEPDRRTNLLKICNSGGAYLNYGSGDSSLKTSIPPWELKDSAFITKDDELKVRDLLRQTLPHFADRELVGCKMCWCADSKDTEYIIDYVPGTEGLIVASGDSGHGFKMMPVFGKWVKVVLEDREQKIGRWKWKDVKEGEGEDISWRVSVKKDLKDVVPMEVPRAMVAKL